MPLGRPTALTPETQAKLLALIAAGNFREVAARACGVSPRTLYRWLRRGKGESEGLYFGFRQALIEAEQGAEIAMLALVFESAKKDSGDAKWFLERKFPDRWGRDALDLRRLAKQLAETEKRVAEMVAALDAKGLPVGAGR